MVLAACICVKLLAYSERDYHGCVSGRVGDCCQADLALWGCWSCSDLQACFARCRSLQHCLCCGPGSYVVKKTSSCTVVQCFVCRTVLCCVVKRCVAIGGVAPCVLCIVVLCGIVWRCVMGLIPHHKFERRLWKSRVNQSDRGRWCGIGTVLVV